MGVLQLLVVCLFFVGTLSTRPTDTQKAALLNEHNTIRQKYSMPNLVWNTSCEDVAEGWTLELKNNQNCNLVHSGTSGFGENLAWWTGSSPLQYGVQLWNGEESLFKCSSTPYTSNGNCLPKNGQTTTTSTWANCGHFTQNIWYNTQSVGCSFQTCNNGATLVSCNYYPAGNYWNIHPLGANGHTKCPGVTQPPPADPPIVTTPTPTPSPTPTPTPTPTPSVTTIPSSPPPATFTSRLTAQEKFNLLDAHNTIRGKYQQPALVWSDEAEKFATNWTTYLKDTKNCLQLQHSSGSGFGENLALWSGTNAIQFGVKLWNDEEVYFKCNTGTTYTSNGNCMAKTPGETTTWQNCGHFTQNIWSGTTSVGCSFDKCSNGYTVMACNYKQPGNYWDVHPLGTNYQSKCPTSPSPPTSTTGTPSPPPSPSPSPSPLPTPPPSTGCFADFRGNKVYTKPCIGQWRYKENGKIISGCLPASTTTSFCATVINSTSLVYKDYGYCNSACTVYYGPVSATDAVQEYDPITLEAEQQSPVPSWAWLIIGITVGAVSSILVVMIILVVRQKSIAHY